MVNQRNKTKKVKKNTKATPTLSTGSKKSCSKPALRLQLHGPCETPPVDESASQNESIYTEITPPPPVPPEDIAAAKKEILQLLGSQTHKQRAPLSSCGASSTHSSSVKASVGQKCKRIFEDGLEDEDEDSGSDSDKGRQEEVHEMPVRGEEEDSNVDEDINEEDQLDPSSEDLPLLGGKAPKGKNTSTCSMYWTSCYFYLCYLNLSVGQNYLACSN